MRRIAVFLLLAVAHVSWSDDGADITDPDEVAALTGLQQRIDKLSAAVTDCVGLGKEHGECLCENESQIIGLNKAVQQLLIAFPNLETIDLVHFKKPGGEAVSQNLSGIRQQAKMELTCN
jgi:hypothetical protein